MKIWVDMDNAPHVLVLEPIIRELEARGHEVVVTAREGLQTGELLRMFGRSYVPFSRHAGARSISKGAELAARSARLLVWAAGKRFDIAVCHGSRAIVLPARMLGIPLVYLTDFEHAFNVIFRKFASLTLVPELLNEGALKSAGFDLTRVRHFPGLKEDLYVHDFEPDDAPLRELGIDPDRDIVALMRPPADEAHYASSESSRLFELAVRRVLDHSQAKVILLPRQPQQGVRLRQTTEGDPRLLIPARVLHGPNLIAHADLVVSGGGTINREAAALGVPAYSVFRGPLGAVDRGLSERGRLRLLGDEGEVAAMPVVRKPSIEARPADTGRRLACWVTDRILESVS